ncbi:MAG: hypothetical protein K2Y39_07710 [Candidatus Obscuribacterales bacterium]|nr:hypothetical protein [Candidatus Obscuribacterales bacterium]
MTMSSFSRTFMPSLMLVLFLATAPSRVFAADARKEAWSFMAYTAAFGRFKAVTTSDTIKADSGVFNYSLEGPTFEKVRVSNPENKSYIETTVAAYASQWSRPLKYPSLKKVGSAKMFGVNCEHYISATDQRGIHVDAWFTSEPRLQRGLTDSLCKVCAVPTGYGLPVRIEFVSKDKAASRAPNMPFQSGLKSNAAAKPIAASKALISKEQEKNELLIFELVNLTKTHAVAEALRIPKDYRLEKDQALFFFSDMDGSNSGVDEMMFSVKQKPKTTVIETKAPPVPKK